MTSLWSPSEVREYAPGIKQHATTVKEYTTERRQSRHSKDDRKYTIGTDNGKATPALLYSDEGGGGTARQQHGGGYRFGRYNWTNVLAVLLLYLSCSTVAAALSNTHKVI